MATIEDFKLSERYSFFDLTVTSNALLQEQNRREALKYKPTLEALAELLERVGKSRRLTVHSGYRCAALNGATAGASPTSQHPRGQAADVTLIGVSVDVLFADTLELLKREKIPFGQLIDEEAQRPYGTTRWMHVSLGRDFWIPERCGEVLKKRDVNGKAQYTVLEKVPPPPQES